MLQAHTECDDPLFTVIESDVNPGFPAGVFQSGYSVGEAECVLALVEQVFRRVPDVLLQTMVRLSRSSVKGVNGAWEDWFEFFGLWSRRLTRVRPGLRLVSGIERRCGPSVAGM